MNKLFQQLLQQAGSRVLPQAQRAVQGFADDLVVPVLRGIATTANPGAANAQLVRSVGAIEDTLVRPVTRSAQKTLANPLTGIPLTFIPGVAARNLVRQTVGSKPPFLIPPRSLNNLRYTADPEQRFLQEFGRTLLPTAERTAASLRPGPSTAAFPFDDTLRLLQGRGQYLQRQAQGAFGALQNFGPTALNPLATQSPTTALGKVGKFFNPLNPVNARSYLTGGVISAFLPENDPNKGNLELFAFTPGGLQSKIATTAIFGATPAGPADESELMRQYSALAQIGKNYKVNGITYDYKTGKAINPPANIFAPASQNGDTLAPPANNPAQRAQDQERSRIAQMTEQDPLFKKYRVAELTKAYNTASPEDKEKIGLEIWATTNPQLAQNLKPGQLGYTQATSAVMSQSPLGQFQAQIGDMQYANKMAQVPGAVAGFQPQTPLTGIPTPAAPQIGVSEAFAKSTPIPGATEMFTDPRKFLSQEELSQTKLALLKKAFESRLK